MKCITKTLLLFVCSFTLGVVIAPVYEVEKEPVSAPAEKKIHHHRNRYGERIKRIA